MAMSFGDLLDGLDWVPMSPDQQSFPSYFWHDGTPLATAPVDFAATFDDAMWMGRKAIEMRTFNRNPLRARPHFVVPRHHHNLDEMIFVFHGEYHINHGDGSDAAVTRVGPGECFLSRAGTPYTMTAGPDGVVYFETWPESVAALETYWHDEGWVRRSERSTG